MSDRNKPVTLKRADAFRVASWLKENMTMIAQERFRQPVLCDVIERETGIKISPNGLANLCQDCGIDRSKLWAAKVPPGTNPSRRLDAIIVELEATQRAVVMLEQALGLTVSRLDVRARLNEMKGGG